LDAVEIKRNYWNTPDVDIANNNCEYNSNRIILKCENTVSALIPLPLVPEIPSIPIRVANVTVDTSRLQNPKIKLNFVINITIPADDTIVSLTFQVFKLYNNMYQKIPVGPKLYYNKSFVLEVTDMFSFFVYDDDDDIFESKCCTYILEVTPL